MKVKTALILSFLAFTFFITCSNTNEFYTIEIIDGVRTVHNIKPLWGDEPKVSLEFVQKIGGLDVTDENYQFYKPRSIAVDVDDNLYVLDAGNFRVQKFDSQGNFLSSIGRQGQGPGEFRSPEWIEIGRQGNVYVSDGRIRNLLVLNQSGRELKRITFPGIFGYFHLTDNDRIFMQTSASRRLMSENIARETRLISVFDSEGNFIKEFGENKDYGVNEMVLSGNSLELCFDKNENIFAAFNSQNRIEKYSPEGDLVFRTKRPLNFEILDLEVESVYSKFSKVTKNIGIDHKNRIWVQTYKKRIMLNDHLSSNRVEVGDPGEYIEFQIFGEEGFLLGNIPVLHAGIMQVIKDRLYFIETRDEMAVYEYRIVEK